MTSTVLIVPGMQGTPHGHWLSWLEAQFPDARRVPHDEPASPVLAHRAGRVKDAIARSTAPVWIVAHGFGCLAAVTAASDQTARVAGALLVSPADPETFGADGPLAAGEHSVPRKTTISGLLPQVPLGFTTLLVAHDGPEDMRLITASQWAERWGSRLVLTGALGGFDPSSHNGPWQQCLRLFLLMQQAQRGLPLGDLTGDDEPAPRRHGWLAKLRRQARSTL